MPTTLDELKKWILANKNGLIVGAVSALAIRAFLFR